MMMNTAIIGIQNLICNKIHGLKDIEEITSICSSCSLLLTCTNNVRRLLNIHNKALKLQSYSKWMSDKSHSYSFDGDHHKCGKNGCCCDSEKSHYSRNGHKRSILVKKTYENSDNCQPKKIVRFADSLGLELVKVKSIEKRDCFEEFNAPNDDDEECINRIHYKHFEIRYDSYTEESSDEDEIEMKLDEDDDEDEDDSDLSISKCKDYLVTEMLNWQIKFEQPCSKSNFLNILNQQKVLLESLYISTGSRSINGIVRVINVCSEKSVKVRYTTDKWLTYHEANAMYIKNPSNEQQTDRFNFRFCVDQLVTNKLAEEINDIDKCLFEIEFAICFEAIGSREYWDNNNNLNYLIICYYN